MAAIASCNHPLLELLMFPHPFQESDLYRAAYDAAATDMLLITLDGVLLDANAAFCAWSEFPRTDLRDKPYLALVPADDGQVFQEACESLRRGDATHCRIHQRYRHKRGCLVLRIIHLSLLCDALGVPICFAGQLVGPQPDGSWQEDPRWHDALRDAERQRAEMELRISEQKFRTLAENSPNIIMRYDNECRRIYVNHAYIKENLARMDDVLQIVPGQAWRANIPAEDYLALLRQVMTDGVPAEILLEWPRLTDGSITSHAINVVPEYDLDGKAVGTLAIGHNITGFKQIERHLQESLDLLQQLMSQREIALETERKHIAQEIHDELGQHLTTLRMGISSLRFQFAQDVPGLTERVQGLVTVVDNAIQVVRDVASSLRPAVMDAGIVSALEWQLAEFSRHSRIAARLSISEGDIPLSDMRATALFRIVQESLTNVARHAAASQVDVAMWRHGYDYLLEVRDNGCGFDCTVPVRKSLGLVGMRERALMLGGELTVTSSPGQGTVIQVRIPVYENGEKS